MKKVKIMLLSIAVLAIVGAALAFKVTKYNDKFCWTYAQFYFGTVWEYYCQDDARWQGEKKCSNITLTNATNVPNEDPVFIENLCTTDPPNCLEKSCVNLTTLYDDIP